MLAIMSVGERPPRATPRSCSTRSTPGSAATPPARSARACASWRERRQVLCITHLPQIASLGERHFSIVKDTTAELDAHDACSQLGEREVVAELVRMLGADDDDSTRAPPRARPAPRRLKHSQALRRRPAGVTLAAMAATRSHAQRARCRRRPGTAARALRELVPLRTSRPARCARAGARSCSSSTWSRGDIALVDHLDIDRVSAEELIAAGAVAVLNCSPSSGGTYPNLGPSCSSRRASCSWTSPTTRCSTRSPTVTRG